MKAKVVDFVIPSLIGLVWGELISLYTNSVEQVWAVWLLSIPFISIFYIIIYPIFRNWILNVPTGRSK